MEKSILVQKNLSLKPFNTFGIEAQTKFFVLIEHTEALIQLLSDQQYQQVPKLILGGGSNILFTKNYDGLIIKIGIKGISVEREDDDFIYVKVGAGENWHQFVTYCIKKGYGGVENLSLIPGTVGAAPIQNIGAYGVELKEIFCQLEGVSLKDATVQHFSNQQCQFGYRDSIFKNSLKHQFAITHVLFRLYKKPKLNTEYQALKDMLNNVSCDKIDIKTISDLVIQIRQKKLPDLRRIGSAGSFFKNPIIPQAHFLKLQKRFASIPHFVTNTDAVKINAGWLIEQCGWKGKRFGSAGVYDKQALVLVNYGSATGIEIFELAKKIQASVFNEFGINLEPEVVLI